MDQEYIVKMQYPSGSVGTWCVKADTAKQAKEIMMRDYPNYIIVSCRKGKKTDYWKHLEELGEA
jgi:hypothetical protein